MSYAIFRVQGVKTLRDLGQLSSHNLREKEAYQSNPDIDMSRSEDNITLVNGKDYIKEFYRITKDYKKEHNEKMKTTRDDRKRSFARMVNDSNSVVADELLFTSDNKFFKKMSKEDIIKWGNTSMDFVYKDLGYTKDQIINAEIHLDEKTPHLHCVVVPLVKKYDNRTKTERYTISKKQYIKDDEHLSLLQDKYHQRMVDNGYDLERGIKGSDAEHFNVKQYKRMTKRINAEISKESGKLEELVNLFEEQTKTTKELLTNKDYYKVKKDTFDTMKKVVNQSKKVMDKMPILNNTMKEVDNYTNSYKSLERDNIHFQKEINKLKDKNEELKEENNNLLDFIYKLLNILKLAFKMVLKLGTEKDKDYVVDESTDIYDNEWYTEKDMVDIAEDTSREEEIFDYIGYSKDNYYKYDDYDYSRSEDKDMEL